MNFINANPPRTMSQDVVNGPAALAPMKKAERIFQLAMEIASSYDLLNARRSGSGDTYTREVVNHLKFVVMDEFGPGVTDQFLSAANHQSVDFWIEDEQTIMEVEYGLCSLDPLLEKEIFTALLAMDAGKDVRRLILVGDPRSVRLWRTATSRSIVEWVERVHNVQILIWEIAESGQSTLPWKAEGTGDR